MAGHGAHASKPSSKRCGSAVKACVCGREPLGRDALLLVRCPYEYYRLRKDAYQGERCWHTVHVQSRQEWSSAWQGANKWR